MKKVLLIEDNAEILENTTEILELAGYQVLQAGNGAGVEMAFRDLPDLVICDIMMPVLDGFEALLLLQQHEQTRDIPFIFLTARSEKADLRKGMELGADDYITKPFSPLDLLQAVEMRIKKAGIRRETFSPDLAGLDRLRQQGSGKHVLQPLSDGRNVRRYKKKETIYLEGNHPRCLYYLQKGKVKVFRRNDDGKELITELYNEGEFFGYTGLLEATTYKDTAEALDESEVAEIPREDFEDLLFGNPAVALQLVHMLAHSITNKEEQLLGLAYSSLRKKVAHALLSFQQKYDMQQNGRFIIDISRDNLAAIAGTATESLIRTLAQFRDEGLVAMKEGAVTILNAQKLSSLLY